MTIAPVLQQTVGAVAARIERRAGHGKDQPAEIGGIARSDQRAGTGGCLDDDKPEADAGDQPVAARKITGARLPAERHFADRQAVAFGDLVQQADIFRRVGLVEAAGKRCDRACVEAGTVGRRIDAAREAGDDGVACTADSRARSSPRIWCR